MNDDDIVLDKIRQQGLLNWELGKEYENKHKIELIKNGEVRLAYNFCVEWRTINWWREDGWNDIIKQRLIESGYVIFADDPECINVLIDWNGPAIEPPKIILSKRG